MSLPSVAAIRLFPPANTPNTIQMEELESQARAWVATTASNIADSRNATLSRDFRPQLRLVHQQVAESYYDPAAQRVLRFWHADGTGNRVRVQRPVFTLSDPRRNHTTYIWEGSQSTQHVAMGLPLNRFTPPNGGNPQRWSTYVPEDARGPGSRRASTLAAFTYTDPDDNGVRRFNPPTDRGRVRLPASGYSDSLMEQPLTRAQRRVLDQPLRNILVKGGRVWSAEVEVDHLNPGQAANVLGVQAGQYSTRPDSPSVVACSDSSVDAEIKISCMRDGSRAHGVLATGTYYQLYEALARARLNTGHHVHIDGTRLADLGGEVAMEVLVAASTFGFANQPVLRAICASGYSRHRAYGGAHQFRTSPDHLSSKGPAIHGQRMLGAARNNMQIAYSGATMEFRMPNGTLEPIRAHAYVALAAALLDFGERAVLDAEPSAVEALRQLTELVQHSHSFAEDVSAQFMIDNLALSDDSFAALAVAGWTAPMLGDAAKQVLINRAPTIDATVFLTQREANDLDREEDHEQALLEDSEFEPGTVHEIHFEDLPHDTSNPIEPVPDRNVSW